MPETLAGLRKTLLVRFFAGFSGLALILFLPAGSLHYWQAWLYLLVLFLPLIFVVGYFLSRSFGRTGRKPIRIPRSFSGACAHTQSEKRIQENARGEI